MRSKFTFRVTLAVALVLGVQYLTDGVSVHYPFGEEELPALSNWWGLILLPAVTWLALGRVRPGYEGEALLKDFVGALLFGGALGFFYEHGRPDLSDFLGEGLVFLMLSYPIYRAGCVLGFVFGASYAFGPVVPVLAACFLAPAAYLGHHGLRLAWELVAALFRTAPDTPAASRAQPAQRAEPQNMQHALHSAE
ncbi:hypothetical protein [Massilia sp. ST3]|uniref:hypothetical protein n=1 Tax=Massilia sp. ST3 TaxID=2824903 RepID=UPI001B83C482|nr:hypothetical protein [Massilia sp. ST3]MBQ5945910.1 hypothetical protein [Massilia sp. ST3]